jgi:hypothetical protein
MMPVTISDVSRLDITKGSKWKSVTGEVAVVISRYHDWRSKEATSFELYLWNKGEFITIRADRFCELIKSNNYSRIQ